MRTMGAAKFKAQCLRIMDEVQKRRETVLITKRGLPMVKIIPAGKPRRSILGCMAGQFQIHGDIVSPVCDPDDWETIKEWDELNRR